MLINFNQINQSQIVTQEFKINLASINNGISSDIEKQSIEIKRYLKEDFFAIKTNFISNLNIKKFVEGIQINQKECGNTEILSYDQQKGITFTPQYFKNMKFNDVSKVAHYFNTINSLNESKLHFLSTISIEMQNIKSSFQIFDDHIHFKIPRIFKLTFQSSPNQFGKKLSFYKSEISYHNIIFVPQKWKRNIFNRVVYKVSVFNDDDSNIDRDLKIVSKNLTNVPLENSKSLKTVFKKIESQETYLGHKINGQIEIEDDTFVENNLLYKGISNNSGQGLFISNSFNKDFNSIIDIDLNGLKQGISLGYHQNFKREIEINEKTLKLIEISNNEASLIKMDFFQLHKDLFAKIIQGNYALEEIKKLSFEKKEYEN
ncbi:MHO_1580 family protein [[Mycoplasma] mobile]|uniref:Uncharacterized protein n=1 Tax=Mycoplasma mobile (strain ATCC 43663 / 163K / NCTC 11711) TaxID=267748 RepID=Q6KI72_MYCM1|nr:hypothetical protein [[Mycoplasma] mobile]AAT27704.1 conserved hypothetical protein [Mycoplasma mobile 163K]